ncbi:MULTISPECIES: hypothetical protein [unclassified Roseovarius]|uniref:hypothetical protein n=1 Tax=unclassified Roseovarius TaxID=2614913 RepID=UPI00273E8CEF|nr:hypothetical protein [Roseovarius sp. MMSF_3350]
MIVDPDKDLEEMTKSQLLAAARMMRKQIRVHRDTSLHDLCWHHPDLWALLPDSPPGGMIVPDWPQFMRGCTRYRQSLDKQLRDAPRSKKEFGE